MTKKVKKILFIIIGLTCKFVFHLLAFITAFLYSYKIGFVLVGIYVFHQLISLWFMKGKKLCAHFEIIRLKGEENE